MSGEHSAFFPYCRVDVEQSSAGDLLVRRRRPHPALGLLLLAPVPMYAYVVSSHVLTGPLGFAGFLVLCQLGYCVQQYRSIQPRTWLFDRRRRNVQAGDRSHPFERLLRVEIDHQTVHPNRGFSHTRFVLTLVWLAGPERMCASRAGTRISSLGGQIALCVGVPLVHLALGREL